MFPAVSETAFACLVDLTARECQCDGYLAAMFFLNTVGIEFADTHTLESAHRSGVAPARALLEGFRHYFSIHAEERGRALPDLIPGTPPHFVMDLLDNIDRRDEDRCVLWYFTQRLIRTQAASLLLRESPETPRTAELRSVFPELIGFIQLALWCAIKVKCGIWPTTEEIDRFQICFQRCVVWMRQLADTFSE